MAYPPVPEKDQKKKFYRENPWAAEAEERRKAQHRKYQESQKTRTPDTDQLGEYVDYEEIDDDDDK